MRYMVSPKVLTDKRFPCVCPTSSSQGTHRQRQVEGLVAFTGSAGSSPVSGTLQHKGLRRIAVTPLCFLTGCLGGKRGATRGLHWGCVAGPREGPRRKMPRPKE